jgi:G3E family GTPase
MPKKTKKRKQSWACVRHTGVIGVWLGTLWLAAGGAGDRIGKAKGKRAMTELIPVTLLTGFLGAGKTTLLNALLKHPGMGKVAVIINEFGDIGLDHDLIETSTETMVLLGSGCLCCTVRGDLGRTMGALAARRAAGELDFARVVIETTGMADPGPILQTLVLDADLEADYQLDGVVTVVDCANGAAILDSQFEAVQQVAMADLLVLTKADLALPTGRRRLEGRLRALNPAAHLLCADHGQIDPAALFGIAPNAGSDKAGALRWIAPFSAPPTGQGPHDRRITAQSIVFSAPLQPIAFDLWLEALLTGVGRDILRIKAVVHVEGMDHPFALHAVQQVIHPPVALPHWPAEDKSSRFVVIGRDLPEGFLAESLKRLTEGADIQHHIL